MNDIMDNKGRFPNSTYDFTLSDPLDESLLEAVGASSDMPKGRIMDLIKEYLCRRGKTCAICQKTCNRKELTLDHRKPTSKGGTDRIENIQLLCRRCLPLKGNSTMLDIRKRLRQAKNQA